MKKTMIAGAAAIALAAPAYAELEGDLSLTYNSQYNFRGINEIISDAAGLFGADTDNVYDAELNLVYGLNENWSLVGGVNINSLSDTSVDHNRYRLGVRYTNDCFSIEVGYQHHSLDQVLSGVGALPDLDTDEIYLNIATDCPLTGGRLNLFVAHDTDQLDGTYAELSLNKSWDLNDKVGLDVTVGVSYSFDYWDDIGGLGIINSGNDWNHAYITVAFPIQAADTNGGLYKQIGRVRLNVLDGLGDLFGPGLQAISQGRYLLFV